MECVPKIHVVNMAEEGTPVQVSLREREIHGETPKWTLLKPNEGLFFTGDLSDAEFKNVMRSEDKDKWDKFLLQDNVRQMKVISFADCRLRRVPISLCQITSLTRVYFTMNELDTLPTEFSHLENLANLKLSANRFCRVPDVLCKLPNLKVLSLQRNKLTNEGLENFKHMSKLEELSLASNDLRNKLSVSVCQLTALTMLDLRNNRIEVLPEEISDLTELRVLNVRQNNLRGLPKSLGKLKYLKLACFAENCIESVMFKTFLRLPDLKDLCLFSNRLKNREELEEFIHKFKMKGKVLRLAENRTADISQAMTCDNPHEFYSHDVTFVHDGTEEVTNWVQRAKQHLLTERNISTTIKSPGNKSTDIQGDIRSCHVVVLVFTQRFHELVDGNDPAGGNIRDALSGVVKRGNLETFLVAVYGPECSISSKWLSAASISIPANLESEGNGNNGNHGTEFDELCGKIKEIKGDRVRLSAASCP